ncbi:MAG: Glycosyl transferase, group 1 [Berkelbacteria bacterium GW2011_GWA1_36_9]|uniref:Glycosyl transferase, group 1 n=1 Tax=Berkelbacteria bacterium GW2011_GWA1_36_9 TaxID=1618331 RepID=A0A0G0FJD3_9BACT|nr:MAG: Glycosyl transferase, group 1 [Berkelbacteria bacterium GW2011_GWA1_36_9]
MKIAILASNRKPIPSPKDLIFAPGVIIYELVEGLVRKGHDVTLFAPEGTKTTAKLITAGTKSLYEDFSDNQNFAKKRASNIEEYLLKDVQYELLMASTAFEYIKKNKFDIVHSHKTLHEIYFSKLIDTPCLFTFHDISKREIPNDISLRRLKKYTKTAYFVSISDSQRHGLEFLNFVDTVYNGVKIEDFKFSNGDKNLLFVGRIDISKGADTAVKLALETKRPLLIVGDVAYNSPGLKIFNKIKKHIDNERIKYLGHVQFDKIKDIYKQAKVLLFPIQQSDSFGLVMIEAMACGTPVIAFNLGSVPEIIKNGQTGFICPVGDTNAMIKAIRKIYEMTESEYQKMRQNCRQHVEENFTIEKMVDGYEKVYEKVIRDWKSKNIH